MRSWEQILRRSRSKAWLAAVFVLAVLLPAAVAAQSTKSTPLRQAIAQAAAGDRVLAAFYRDNGFEPLWTGRTRKHRLRREALLIALRGASDHALPVSEYPATEIAARMKRARKAPDRGTLDVYLSKIYLAYAADIGSGIVNPKRINYDDEDKRGEIARRRPIRDPRALLDGIFVSNAKAYFSLLPPKAPEYNRLMKAKLDLEKIIARGGWGAKVNARRLEPGHTGPQVVGLRDRLIAMGFLKRNARASYDPELTRAVQVFQTAHGLFADGIVGPGSLRMLNTSPNKRLAQIIVAMERERWMNFDRGARFIEVNIPDFSAKIIENGVATFQTRAVVGAAEDERRTPEFSDEMEHMIFNPGWYVPRDIATMEYLPLLQEDPFAVAHLELLDEDGEPVERETVDFASLDEETWPFLMKEPPSQVNALGLVKFMFPNRYNIYLHDTPQKVLFSKEARAFSHGCIRLGDPFDFAHALLSLQTEDTQRVIDDALAEEDEFRVDLDEHVPVHVIYRSARVDAKGRLQFRRDIYQRDSAIFSALRRAGVVLGG